MMWKTRRDFVPNGSQIVSALLKMLSASGVIGRVGQDMTCETTIEDHYTSSKLGAASYDDRVIEISRTGFGWVSRALPGPGVG